MPKKQEKSRSLLLAEEAVTDPADVYESFVDHTIRTSSPGNCLGR